LLKSIARTNPRSAQGQIDDHITQLLGEELQRMDRTRDYQAIVRALDEGEVTIEQLALVAGWTNDETARRVVACRRIVARAT
jgi:hypothetical protein